MWPLAGAGEEEEEGDKVEGEGGGNGGERDKGGQGEEEVEGAEEDSGWDAGREPGTDTEQEAGGEGAEKRGGGGEVDLSLKRLVNFSIMLSLEASTLASSAVMPLGSLVLCVFKCSMPCLTSSSVNKPFGCCPSSLFAIMKAWT